MTETPTTIAQRGGSGITVNAYDDVIRIAVDTTNYLSNMDRWDTGGTVTTVVSLDPDQAVALAHRLLELATGAAS